jgi:hypothetical protein
MVIGADDTLMVARDDATEGVNAKPLTLAHRAHRRKKCDILRRLRFLDLSYRRDPVF